jgi:tetratricopeptide (TPR) repeat protein
MVPTFAPTPPSRVISAGLLCLVLGAVASPADGEIPCEEAIRKAQEAFSAFTAKDYLKAQTLLQQAIELDQKFVPKSKDYLREALRQFQSEPRNIKAAFEAVAKAIKDDPESPEPYYIRAQMFRMLNKLEDALDDLDTALRFKPDHEGAIRELAEILLGDTQFAGEAVKRFKKLSASNPDNIMLLDILGQAYEANANFEEAEKLYADLITKEPNRLDFHDAYVKALGVPAAIEVYERKLADQPQASPILKQILGGLYLEDIKDESDEERQKKRTKAYPLLRDVIRAGGLDPGRRFRIAKLMGRAAQTKEQYQEAASQVQLALRGMDPNLRDRRSAQLLYRATYEYGKLLIKAGKPEQAIAQLRNAQIIFRQLGTDEEPIDTVFQLGKAYVEWNRREEAEVYFRQLLNSDLTRSADQEVLEGLCDIYIKGKDYKNAAKFLERAVKKYPEKTALQLDYAEALEGVGNWPLCIDQATKFVEDKTIGLKARLVLARAYLATKQYDLAIEQFRKVEGSTVWSNSDVELFARAMLDGNRTDAALKYIEKAYQANPSNESLKLLYAKVLNIVGRLDEASRLCEEVTKANETSDTAWHLRGDLEMETAKKLEGEERVSHLRQAVGHYKAAFGLKPSQEVLAKRGVAERDLNQAESEIQARKDRVRSYLYAAGLVLAAAIPLGLLWVYSRRQWASRCFAQVLDLENDLKKLIRNRVSVCFNNNWDRLGEEPFQGRVDYRYLKRKMTEDSKKDILDVANFGHLVGIIDRGWKVLGFDKMSVPGTQSLIIAGMSYVGNCRNAIFHSDELTELQGHKDQRQRRKQKLSRRVVDASKWVLSGFGAFGPGRLGAHLDRQVSTSIKAIRNNFDLTAPTDADAGEAKGMLIAEALYWDESPRGGVHGGQQ